MRDINMTEMEMKARENHRNGNNCSASLAMAFAEKLGIDKTKEYEQFTAKSVIGCILIGAGTLFMVL